MSAPEQSNPQPPSGGGQPGLPGNQEPVAVAEPAPDRSAATDSDRPDTTRPAARLVRRASPGRIRNFLRRSLMLAGIVAVVVLSGFYWLRGGRVVVSDNAYIRAPKLMVSTDISGIVSSIEVEQGQKVKAGQVLFRLDPHQFEIALGAARAQLELVRQEVKAAQRDYERILADIGVQKVQVSAAVVAFERANELVKRRAGSRAALDQAKFALEGARKRLVSLQQQARAALTRLGGAAGRPPEQDPKFREARAKVAEAERLLSRTIVRAPFAGVVTAVESLQKGTFLVAQTAALTNTGAVGLVAAHELWIDSNIKETDLTHVRPGNPVGVTVDAYPGRRWNAVVKSIFPATGSEFSILPAQNASGNWVKVVQRIPVRIALHRNPGDPPLRAGMSVVVHIDTGHERKMRDLWRLLGIKSDPLPAVSAQIESWTARRAGASATSSR